jgi:SNF2 family DNA or RNA helicase
MILQKDKEPAADGEEKKSSGRSFQKQQFFTNLARGEFHKDDIENDAEPAERFSKTTGSARMHVYWLRAANKLIHALPNVFTGAVRTDGKDLSRKYVDGLDLEAEDLHRFIFLFNQFYILKVRKTDLGKNKTPSRQDPVLPIFCLPGEANANTELETTKNLIAFENLRRTAVSTDSLLRSFHFHSDEERDRQPEALDNVGENKVTLLDGLPRLEGEDQAELFDYLASQVTYLYDDRNKRNKFFTPPSQSVVFRKQCHKATEEDKRQEAENALHPNEQARFKQERFRKLQKQLNSRSAAPPSWEETVEMLGLDVRDLDKVDDDTKQPFLILYRGLKLMPWQPQAAAFMLKMIEGPLKACLNSDDTGLGKTVSSLVAIVQRSINTQAALDRYRDQYEHIVGPHRIDDDARTDEEIIAQCGLQKQVSDLGSRPEHKPVLVVVPPSALGAWSSDAAKFFQPPKTAPAEDQRRAVELYTFFGLSGAATIVEQRSLGTSPQDLMEFCQSLDRGDEATSRTVVLSTFRCLAKRCLEERIGWIRRKIEPDEDAMNAQTLSGATGQNLDVEMDEGDSTLDPTSSNNAEVDPDDEKDVDEPDIDDDQFWEQIQYAKLLIPDDLWSIIIADEAHRVKNRGSKQAMVLYKQKSAYILNTATPFINSVDDLHGPLLFLFKSVEKQVRAASLQQPNRQGYKQLAEDFEEHYQRDLHSIPHNRLNMYLSALDPATFKTLIRSESGVAGLNLSHDIIPLPMMLTCLRRVMGDALNVHGREIVLGAEIPPFELTIAVVRHGAVEASVYRAAHRECIAEPQSDKRLASQVNADNDSRHPSNIRRRRLQHAALNPALDQMYRRNVGNEAQGIQKFFKQGIDSFSIYHAYTKNDLHHPLPETRPAMAKYMADCSCKLQALSAEIQEVVIRQDRKMLVYADWPLNLWLIELFLKVLNIPFLSIRAGITTSQRLEAEHAYNNDPAIKILVCSARSASESLNLQKGGWHIVIMDVIPINKLLQIIGRGFRVGQKHAQTIKMFVADETYDQYLLFKYINQYNRQVSGTAKLDIPEDVYANVDNKLRMEYENQSDKKAWRSHVDEVLRDAYVGGLVRCILGLRGDLNDDWDDVQDVQKKNLSPEEQLFRLAQGGDVANEVLEQLKKKSETAAQNPDLPRTVDADQLPDAPQPVASGSPNRVGPDPIRATAFSAPMLARPIVQHVFSESEHVEALIAAAEKMAAALPFRLHNITPEHCLREAKDWVSYPSEHIDQALNQLRTRSRSLNAELFSMLHLLLLLITLQCMANFCLLDMQLDGNDLTVPNSSEGEDMSKDSGMFRPSVNCRKACF